MIVPGTLYKITTTRPFLIANGDSTMVDRGETVMYLSHQVVNGHRVRAYFLHRGQILSEGATIRHHANDLLLTLMTCLDDMEEIW